jgi:hypothetical protein
LLRGTVKNKAQYLVFAEVTAIVRERDLLRQNADANRHRPRLIRKIARVLDQLPQPPRREFGSMLFEVRESLHDLLRVIAMQNSIGLGV